MYEGSGEKKLKVYDLVLNKVVIEKDLHLDNNELNGEFI